MEPVASPRKQRKSLRKRRYVKYVNFLRKQLRRRTSVEVRSTSQWESYLQQFRSFHGQEDTTRTMQADAFWNNYATAREWQNRHTITWWRSRCIALEQENEILRNKIRSLARNRNRNSTAKNTNHDQYSHETLGADGDPEEEEAASENLEFNITEDMLDFFETSERHRREMRERRRAEEQKITKKRDTKDESIVINAPENLRAKREEAELLYGEAAPKILAMETALQVAANRYKDLSNAQYWPNIPLKP